MCCHGRECKRSKRCARREARRASCAERREQWDPSRLRLRFRQIKITQSVVILAYYLSVLYSGALTGQGGIGTTLHLLTCMTLIFTTWTLVFSIWGSGSKVPLALSITGDSICLALQLQAIIAVFVAKPSRRCFTGHFDRAGPSCGAVWSSLIFSNILLSSFIHTIVRAAILISALKCQSRQRLPVSIQDSTPDSIQDSTPDAIQDSTLDMPQDSTQDGLPPSYPASEASLPAYPGAETFRLDGAGGGRKGGPRDTSVASSSTLEGLVVTPGSSEESDSDDSSEDRPLLHI